MKRITQALFALTLVFGVTRPAHAERMLAACSNLLSISSTEAEVVYYEAEADLGTETAGRLWAAYHRLKNKCSNNPTGNIVVNVEPRVRAFLQAHR